MTAVSDRDAVIVATARSPIGRAGKGSLRDAAPGRPRRHDRARRARQGAGSSTRPTSTTCTSAAACPAASRASTWRAWSPRCSATTACPAATVTRYCASSLQTTRMAFHAIKAGEGDVFVSAGVETVSRYARGNSDGLPPEAQALVGGALAATRSSPRRIARTEARAAGGAPTWHDPREDGAVPDIYLAMGQTAENLAQIKGVTREDMDEFGVRSRRTSPRRRSPTASGPARSPR